MRFDKFTTRFQAVLSDAQSLAAGNDNQFIASEMKDEYINAAGKDVTQAWLNYVAPLVGELPKMGRL